jgi:signal transduction histidine kinase
MPHAGEIVVEVNTTGKEVQIQVYDRGIGIPKDILTKISQPFYTTKETGTGLGLTICYRIIEKPPRKDASGK